MAISLFIMLLVVDMGTVEGLRFRHKAVTVVVVITALMICRPFIQTLRVFERPRSYNG